MFQSSEREWSATQSARLYGVSGWGKRYFDVGPDGALLLRGAALGCEKSVPLPRVVSEVEAGGRPTPLLLRFPAILEDRLRLLHDGFRDAIEATGYAQHYRGVYPIKVNQQEEILRSIGEIGESLHFGFEAGSKPELIAAMAYLRGDDRLLVCNGYKDDEFIDLALGATRMGLKVILVIELPGELEAIARRSRILGVEPMIGIRVKLATEGHGAWAASGGERSPFGVNFSQLRAMLDSLRRDGREHWLQMLHCHQGSQISRLETIREATEEAARIYSEIHRAGMAPQYLNLGGGAAIDYSGTHSDGEESADYTLAEYCRSVVETTARVCRRDGAPEPVLVTESGRTVTAPYAALIVKVLDVNRFDLGVDPLVPSESPAVFHELATLGCNVKVDELEAVFEEVMWRKRGILDAFRRGDVSLEERDLAEKICSRVMTVLVEKSRTLPPTQLSRRLRELEADLSDHVYCNFSIFQSLPDSWAIGQVFPVMPIQRLDEWPTRTSVVHDITCDSDGSIKRYVVDGRKQRSIPLHAIGEGESYYIGIFLVGAYQETLSDLHNLLGDTHVVSVTARDDGEIAYSTEVSGDSIAQVLGYMEHSPLVLERRFERRVEEAKSKGRIDDDAGQAILEAFRHGMQSYTYYED